MEGPKSEHVNSDDDRVKQLKAQILDVVTRYEKGEASYREAIPLINDIQRINYTSLQRKFPERFSADYDTIARAKLSPDNVLHTELLANHPVTKQIELLDFEFWREAFINCDLGTTLPKEGTASDIFKAVLRHHLSECGAKLQAETIMNIELRYMVKPVLGPEDFLTAQEFIVKDLET